LRKTGVVPPPSLHPRVSVMAWTVTALPFVMFFTCAVFTPPAFVQRLDTVNDGNKTRLHCAIGPGESDCEPSRVGTACCCSAPQGVMLKKLIVAQ